jgi:hypothetical protein
MDLDSAFRETTRGGVMCRVELAQNVHVSWLHAESEQGIDQASGRLQQVLNCDDVRPGEAFRRMLLDMGSEGVENRKPRELHARRQ